MKKSTDKSDNQEQWLRAAAGSVGGAAGWAAGFAGSQKLGNKVARNVERKTTARAILELRRAKVPKAVSDPLAEAAHKVEARAGKLSSAASRLDTLTRPLTGVGSADVKEAVRGGADDIERAAKRGAAGLVRAQGRAYGRVAGLATRAAVVGSLAALGGVAGDAAADIGAANARRWSKGEEGTDEVRRVSIPGLIGGAALGAGAQIAAETRRRFRYNPKGKLAAGLTAGSLGAFVGERAGDIKAARVPDLSKRAGDGHITEAERQQRVNAAKARWEKHSSMGGDAAPPAKKPWTGQQLGLGRDVRVQAQSMLSPVWQHNYQGDEWGYGREGAPKEQGGKTYLSFPRTPLKPKAMSDEEFVAVARRAKALADARREDIIAEGLGLKLIGEDGRDRLRNRRRQTSIPESKRNDREAIRLAFNHARALAMNDVSLVRVDSFNFTPEAKEKLRGMEHFIKRARRQMQNTFRDDPVVGPVAAQSRREHGYLFRDGRLGPDGQPKRYLPYHATVVKAAGGALMKRQKGAPLSEEELQQRRDAAKARGREQARQGAVVMGTAAGVTSGLLLGGLAGQAIGGVTSGAAARSAARANEAAGTIAVSVRGAQAAGRAYDAEKARLAGKRPSSSRALVSAKDGSIIPPSLASIMREGEGHATRGRAAIQALASANRRTRLFNMGTRLAPAAALVGAAAGGVMAYRASGRNFDERAAERDRRSAARAAAPTA